MFTDNENLKNTVKKKPKAFGVYTKEMHSEIDKLWGDFLKMTNNSIFGSIDLDFSSFVDEDYNQDSEEDALSTNFDLWFK